MWPQFPVPSGICPERWFPVKTEKGVHIFSWESLAWDDSWRFSSKVVAVESDGDDDSWIAITRTGTRYFLSAATMHREPTLMQREDQILANLVESGNYRKINLIDWEFFLEDQFGL